MGGAAATCNHSSHVPTVAIASRCVCVCLRVPRILDSIGLRRILDRSEVSLVGVTVWQYAGHVDVAARSPPSSACVLVVYSC